jgi:hypothetical protein
MNSRQLIANKNDYDPGWALESMYRKEKGDELARIAEYELGKPQYKDHPELVMELLGQLDRIPNKNRILQLLAKDVLSKPEWTSHPELVMALIRQGAGAAVREYIFSKPYWRDHPEFEKILCATFSDQSKESRLAYARHLLKHPELEVENRREIVKAIFLDAQAMKDLLITWSPSEERRREFLQDLMSDPQSRQDKRIHGVLAEFFFSRPFSLEYRNHLRDMISLGLADEQIAEHVLSQSFWGEYPELAKALLEKKSVSEKAVRAILSKEHLAKYPELIEAVVQNKTAENRQVIEKVLEGILEKPMWNNNLRLRWLSGGESPTVKNLQSGLRNESRGKPPGAPPGICGRILGFLGGD